jgi:glycosyltransferase involved in cell wall biosynthesis
MLTVWGSDILVAPHQSKWIRKMTLYILRRITLITADANYLAEQTQALVPKTKLPLHICQFGVEPLDVKTEKENIIYSNRGHYPIYRIDLIIKAFEHFSKNTKESWKLVIAGAGEQTDSLKALASSLDLDQKIEFVGFLSAQKNAEWYARSTYYISIPISDGTAVSLLEAMYYGCVPIVSDLPANREWITHKQNGWIVSDLNANYIEEARTINTNESRTLNRELVEKSGTSEASKKQFLNAITTTINLHSKHSNE